MPCFKIVNIFNFSIGWTILYSILVADGFEASTLCMAGNFSYFCCPDQKFIYFKQPIIYLMCTYRSISLLDLIWYVVCQYLKTAVVGEL